MDQSILIAFGLTLFAGLATGVGSIIAFCARRTNKKFLSFALGLSAGVMIYISFVEMLVESQKGLSVSLESFGEYAGGLIALGCLFGGMLIVALIDRLVPSLENPHEVRSVEDMERKPKSKSKLMRIGVMTAIAIAVHNFPEGIATFVAALDDPALGVAIAIAIAIHNIPEGIAVSVPIYHATGSRKKAFWWSFFSGFAEFLGAILTFLFLMPFLSDSGIVMDCIFATVAGIMIYISFDELLPAAREYGEHHISIYGLLTGIAIMALSLVFLAH